MGGTGNILDSVGLYPFEVMLEFEKKATEKPNDPKEWMFDYKDARGNGSSVTLEFRGIVRRYELKGIDIPKDSELRKGKANAPILRVYIDRNGKPMPGSGLTAKVSAWTHDFPSGKSNVWYIREGIGENYLIRLRDANTTFREAFLLDRAEIKAEDFRANDGVIREKMDSLETESPAVKFRFAPIK